MSGSVTVGAVCFQEYDGDYPGFLDLAARLGLSWVELKFEPPICRKEGSVKYRAIRDKSEALGIGLSMHTPFVGLNIASINRDERDSSVNRIREALDAAAEMGITYATIHGGHLRPEDYTPDNWERSKEYNLESLGILAEYGRSSGVCLCLENGNAFKRNLIKHGLHPGEMKDIRRQVGDHLKFTVDFGHAMYFSTDPSYLVSELGKNNVKLSHIHSNYQLADTHNPLDTGLLEYEKIVARYRAEEWSFPLSIEMKNVKNLEKSAALLYSCIKSTES